MPSKKAKERKHNRKRARIELSARKTEVNRKRRLSNRVKRSAILDIDSNAKVKIIDQNTYIDGDRVEVVNGKIVPSALPEGAIKTECDYDPDDAPRSTFWGDDLPEDEHEGAEELAKHDVDLGAKVGRQIDDAIEKQRLYAHKQLEERSLLCQMCGKVRESIQTTLCEMCAKLQANEDELRRKDHERAMRPREAKKVVKKGMFDVIKGKLRISNEG